jgi:Ran-binding protein 3
VTDDINESDPESQSSNRKARLLMRADGTHRVILNSPVFRGMQFGASDGSPPTGKIMHLQSLEEAKPVPLQIKVGPVHCVAGEQMLTIYRLGKKRF